MFNIPNNMEAIFDEGKCKQHVLEVRSLCMQGIFGKYARVHVPLAVVMNAL